MRVIKRPFIVVWHLMRSRRGRVVIATAVGLAMFGTRARTVISRVPERSRSALQDVTTEVRGLVGKGQAAEQQPAGTQGIAGARAGAAASTNGAGTAATTEPAQPAAENAADSAANIAGDQPAMPATASAEEEIVTVPAGEDESGTFRPTRAETDEFGVVVTDDAPAGLAAGNWVEGDGTPSCPDDFPIKGNANSRIYHLPGESSYERTIAELCFATEEDAAAAGYRPRSK